MAIVIPASSLFAQDYQPLEIKNIQPKEILPIVGQVEAWDKKVYNRIEHLRIAEATRIRDMMWQYGAGNHSPEEYQQLMNRLNTGMLLETPKWYSNYEVIWWDCIDEPTNHSHNEWNILNTLIEHATFNVVNPSNRDWNECVKEVVIQNPNNIYILWMSAFAYGDKSLYNSWNNNAIKELSRSKKFLLFIAWTNIWTKNGVLKNKIYHEDVNWDEHWVYGAPSRANWRNDNSVDRHLLVTIWTDFRWDINQTKEKSESSKFPVWFHNDVLFAGRAFPYVSWSNNQVTWEPWKYATSYTNYTNVAIIDLCFQMFAEVKDVDKLLEMIRSTALTDYIRFDLNWDGDTDDDIDGQPESQPLILMNPAGFFQKYLMPLNLPANIKTDETVALEKGYYHGIIFNIPGAEVNINGEWIAFTENNKDLILAQNPMTIEWRLNGDLLSRYGYKQGDTVTGQILVIDDQWNGLNISKDFSISMEASPDGINAATFDATAETWYTIDGHRLDTKPTTPGVYIQNGQKVIVK